MTFAKEMNRYMPLIAAVLLLAACDRTEVAETQTISAPSDDEVAAILKADNRASRLTDEQAREHFKWRTGAELPEEASYIDGCDQFTESDTYALFKFRLPADSARALIAEVAPGWRGHAAEWSPYGKLTSDAPYSLRLAGRDDDFLLKYQEDIQVLRFEESED